MELLTQNHRRRTLFGSSEYITDISLLCTATERQVIADHRLDRIQLFAVPEIEINQQRSMQAFERSDARSVFFSNDAGKLLIDILAGLIHAARSRMAFSVTVADAIAGTTIRCSDLFQQLEAEQQINAAFDDLHRTVENALAFSIGREQVLVPEEADETNAITPARWANPQDWWGNPNG